ncbi:vWA domain-containing protein [Pontiella sulfatireligans]|uniref:VWFA domain-containing protein n=1 Tax=Pontiella sulfatireligans TaxID=2750658 RepID=A0A6C2UK85_9BACT|nr:hypothetical protein [Pontiella sulfatireligans]VGO19724.1 hypothetical protein SCARR_01783 [Pontiella sulfatireligans]
MKKKFFAKHAKSSAALVSLGIHAVLIVLALSFVAVTVITKEDQVFKAKPVKRPKMQLKKLQVPVNFKKKKTQKPKLRKRILVQPKINQTMPDLRLPEITGIKGGMGSAADGLGGGGGVGFAMPEMSLFGIKSRGEKVFIILDASAFMMVDSMGGIPAYTIIKSELVRILEGLNSTVLFNIAVYGGGEVTLFPNMVVATPANVAKVDDWLKPLNAVKKGMGDKDYGPKTLGPGGVKISGDFKVEPLKSTPGGWAKPTLLAMKQQADVVFLLTCRWGSELRYKTGTRDRDWDESDQQKYKENVEKARALFKKENDRRRAKGQAPRVIARGNNGLVRAYIPGARIPPSGTTFANYSPEMMVEAFDNTQTKSKAATPSHSGISKKKDKFSINVIHFVPAGSGSAEDPKLSKLAKETRGEYQKIKGMDAIQSYVSAGSAD